MTMSMGLRENLHRVNLGYECVSERGTERGDKERDVSVRERESKFDFKYFSAKPK